VQKIKYSRPSGYGNVAISAMTQAVARAATTGDADLIAPDRSSEPGRRLSFVVCRGVNRGSVDTEAITILAILY
jgi:hypothetical protein